MNEVSVVQAKNTEDLIRQLGTAGIENGPRTGEERRTTVSSEAYLGRRYFLYAAERGWIQFPLSIEHREKPDFEVVERTGAHGLEVTEACPSEDGREMAKSELEMAAIELEMAKKVSSIWH